MIALTPDLLARLRANAEATRTAQAAGDREPDHRPVIKLFNPLGAATWIATELDEDGDTLFGLCEALHKPKYVEHGVMLSAVFPAPLSAAPGHKCFA